MKSKAAMMVLLLLSGIIAGCTGDADEGDNEDIDSTTLQNLFDESFQDFVNNTTVNVNNHYHNNTTVINYHTTNDYNNTTNVDEGDVNNNYNDNSNNNYSLGGQDSESSVMQVFTVEWDWDSATENYDYANHIISMDQYYFLNVSSTGNSEMEILVDSNDPTLLMSFEYNGNNVEFRDITCEQYLNLISEGPSSSDFMDWLFERYGVADYYWHYVDGIGEWLNDMYDGDNSSSSPLGNQCGFFYEDEDLWSMSQSYTIPLFDIQIESGEAIEMLVYPQTLDFLSLECEDGFSSSTNLSGFSHLIGGQSECTLTGWATVREYWGWGYVEDWHLDPSFVTPNMPQWWNNTWKSEDDEWVVFVPDQCVLGQHEFAYVTQSDVAESFVVYFMKHHVEVYEADEE